MRGFLARVRNFLGVGIPSHGLGLPPSSQAAPAQPACLGVRFDTVHGESYYHDHLAALVEELIAKGQVPIEFPHDCREGICGTCGTIW